MTYNKILIIVTISVAAIGCQSHKNSEIIQTADSLLWASSTSCQTYIDKNQDKVTAYEQKRLFLTKEHAKFRSQMDFENDSVLDELAVYFEKNLDYDAVGEIKYLQGARQLHLGEYFKATEYLKEAEKSYAKATFNKPLLIGMLYFYLGAATERSRFFDIACEYYTKALPHLYESNIPLYISAAYHHLGKSTHDEDSAKLFLDSAYYYATQIDDPFYRKEIEVVKALSFNNDETENQEKLINDILYLCDSCHQYYYISPLAHIYLNKNELNKAQIILQKLATDTAIDIWAKEQYYTIKAELAYKSKNKDEAYATIKALHKWQTEEIENSAFANTYIISQKYDVAKEQELRLQEQIQKQRAYFWIVIVLLVCICIGGYTYYIYKKGKLELQISEEQKKRLEQELNINRAVLRARISERLEFARHLYFWGSHHSEAIPDILGSLSPTRARNDSSNWKEFYQEFNLCYNNLLERLVNDFPALTDTDLQYIVITYLGFNITDMAFILRIKTRTIWNRRSHVKQHMSMPEDKNLDDWIVNEMGKEYGIAEPQRIQQLPGKKIRKEEDRNTK